mmetsp:Transcript_25772/g.35889  ORF Transcript_25772/g.35889 Transcript_25772/m.35889 type:complete len:400 (+) Transcript_25772:318-1517(+)|eukprot:CAMPEP_0184495728 /NCGR_PEP_ID=MMETSP0113_2-20130426/32139_1 /TAXON_ID=91329 /ORGANISM="Norrisiella sphaerica, Strain BC52" /LENGTH=399 /DNA_ID=CAMNT_0026882041 /DNA_START=221 /DNA_END=1420 /DNA_ORIENTATION=+
MHRGPPVLNKICQYKWELQQNERLDKRIKGVKANVDNKKPAEYSHLKHKRKKEQLMEERYTQIERENRILLQKMSHIMTHNTIDNVNKTKPRSMNAGIRRREQERIQQENHALLKRIQNKKGSLSKKSWQSHHRAHQERLRIMKDCNPKDYVKTKSGSSRKKKTHKLNPLDHGGFKAFAKTKSTKTMGKKENRAKAAENVIYKEGRLIDDQYVIVTVIENIVERVFSFRTYALETSHQNRVDVPAITIRDCIEDDSLMRAERHDELAMALIPRLRFKNEKLIFDTSAQNSEAFQHSQKIASATAQKLLNGISKREGKLSKDDTEAKNSIEKLEEEAQKKLTKQMNIANRAQVEKEKAEAKARADAEKTEKERQAKLIREAEEKEADAALAADAVAEGDN